MHNAIFSKEIFQFIFYFYLLFKKNFINLNKFTDYFPIINSNSNIQLNNKNELTHFPFYTL